MSATLGIDFGAKYIGIALVEHAESVANKVRYAATVIVDARKLNELSETRAMSRRLRRTRKTHRRRLRHLRQALQCLPSAEADVIVRFCCRRGYGYQADAEGEADLPRFACSRQEFFTALRSEIDRVVSAPEQRKHVADLCARHLNEACQRDQELRPARFDNRRPSHCQWEGCCKHVPRAANAVKERVQQSLFAWLCPCFAVCTDTEGFRRYVEEFIQELIYLSGSAQAIKRKLGKEEAKQPVKELQKDRRKLFERLLERVRTEAPEAVAQPFMESWEKYYRKLLLRILDEPGTGRVRFCRDHSAAYVTHLLTGKVLPLRQEVRAADLISRKQQILFSRLWRLVESRLLPLVGRIDRVVVERVAFDILAGPFRVRQELSEEKSTAMYWHGPQYGYASRREMLRAEFCGLCAYCGEAGPVEEVEHLFPRSQFPFDSYFNVVPACHACNIRKGARTPREAGMTIHPAGYEAYAKYVEGRKPPHLYHTIKKGMLKLLQRPQEQEQAERLLSMIAQNLVTITATQRSPRPLARYLATKLAEKTGQRPQADFTSGRHTALYRSVLLPEYEKPQGEEKATDGPERLRNHGVDAILLACRLPSATALENKHWGIGQRLIHEWREKVRTQGPELTFGLPRVIEPPPPIPFFEIEEGEGYYAIELTAFNWNQKRKATHTLDPFGMTQNNIPLKRSSAVKVLENLLKKEKRDQQIDNVAHPALRKLLDTHREEAPVTFITWLQTTVRAGLGEPTSQHPSDQTRYRLLHEFLNALPSQVIESPTLLPPTIGVRCLVKGSQNKTDIKRLHPKNLEVFQYYQAQPVVKEMRVFYRGTGDTLDRSKPFRFVVNQAWQVTLLHKPARTNVTSLPDILQQGRSYGAAQPFKEFRKAWEAAFRQYELENCFHRRFSLAQGCLIEKMNGQLILFRNFDSSAIWNKSQTFCDIRRVHRSPLTAHQGGDPECAVK